MSAPPPDPLPTVAPGGTLCSLDALADGRARMFTIRFEDGEEVPCFVLRRGGAVVAYVNRCPHQGYPLGCADGAFLTGDGGRLLCEMHGATFDIETGEMLSGPESRDRHLLAVPLAVADGAVRLAPRAS